MKKLFMIYMLSMLSTIFLLYGCLTEEKCPEFIKWDVISKQIYWYKKLSEEVGMNLPKDLVLLNHSNGGGRLDKYYEWLVSSSSIFELPIMNQPGIIRYSEMPIYNSTKVIESRLKKIKLKDVDRSYLSEWEKGEYLFRGLAVVSSTKNYLLIERYTRK